MGFDLEFQDFEGELEALPGRYAAPSGSLLLAFEGGRLAGCVALRSLDAEVCEMKRLYVRPASRGRDIGRALVQRIIDEGRQIGYKRMRLDAIRTMTAAVGLYKSMGFSEIAPYRYNPLEGAVYMELSLESTRID